MFILWIGILHRAHAGT